MKTTGLLAATAAAILFCGSAAHAAVIEVNSGVFDAAIAAYQPIGQSFTAIDPTLLSIGFAYSDINPGSPNTQVTIDLFEGEGFGGTLVASRSFFLPAVLPTTSQPPVIFDTDFSGVGLSVGGVYTAALAVAGASFKVAAVHGFDTYAGGQGIGGACADCDFNFRVVGEGVGAAVPEPGVWALMILGFGFAGATLRRRPAHPAGHGAQG